MPRVNRNQLCSGTGSNWIVRARYYPSAVRSLLMTFQLQAGDKQVKLGALHWGPKDILFALVCRSLVGPYNLPFFVVDSFELLQLRDSSEAF